MGGRASKELIESQAVVSRLTSELQVRTNLHYSKFEYSELRKKIRGETCGASDEDRDWTHEYSELACFFHTFVIHPTKLIFSSYSFAARQKAMRDLESKQASASSATALQQQVSVLTSSLGECKVLHVCCQIVMCASHFENNNKIQHGKKSSYKHIPGLILATP
jgi:hypothetical protein